MWFTSDNAGPTAPEVIEAMAAANAEYAAPYGADPLTQSVQEKIREVFEAPDAAVYFVATGTAANSLSLACLCPPWATIYCHEISHVEEGECAAPEFFTGGAKLTVLPGARAKIDPDALSRTLDNAAQNGVNSVQKGALSLTNATEEGAVYTVAEIQALCDLAKYHGIGVHMDGARFTNALVSLGCTPAEMTWKAGVDILCFGGTKNGLPGAEAVVLFDPQKAFEFELRRKRSGHLLSKNRLLSAQMQAYLTDDLWLRLARQANAAAAHLSDGIEGIKGAHLMHPTEANIIFAYLPRSLLNNAKKGGAHFHPVPHGQSFEGPGEDLLSIRLVCNWATTRNEIDSFLALLA